VTEEQIKAVVKAVLAAQCRQRESDVLMAAKNLLHALDSGFLAYKADVPESAFVRSLREAIARAEG
jgi:hypothetical protein